MGWWEGIVPDFSEAGTKEGRKALGRGWGTAYHLADNIIGFDDEVQTGGEDMGQFLNWAIGNPLEAADMAKGYLDKAMFEGPEAFGGVEEMGQSVFENLAKPMIAPGAIGTALKGGLIADPTAVGVNSPWPTKGSGPNGKWLKGDKDPIGYGGVEQPKPIWETDYDYTQVHPLLGRKPVTIDDLKGKVMIGHKGDRSATGKLITRIEDYDFGDGVLADGGTDFMRGPSFQGPDQAVWASSPSIMSGFQSKIKRTMDEFDTDQIIGGTTTMGANPVDFTRFAGEGYGKMLQQSDILKKDGKAFDEMIRKGSSTFKPAPDFPGVHSDELVDWMYNTSSDARKSVIRRGDSAAWQKKGTPNAGPLRWALTDDTQRHLDSGMVGMGITDLSEGLPLLKDPAVPHSTYKVQGKGDYIGGFERPVPKEVLWHDWFNDPRNQIDAKGRPMTAENMGYTWEKRTPGLLIDDKVIERVNRWLEDNPQ